MEKLRIIYSKSKEAIYMSHLDSVKVFEQALRRANIPVSYIKSDEQNLELVFAHPLSVGIESTGEVAEIVLDEIVQPHYFIKQLNNELPNGITVLSAEYVDPSEKSVIYRVYAATYIISFVYNKNKFIGKNNREVEDIKKYYIDNMKNYLLQEHILVLKKSKNRMERIDIKPQIITFDFLIDGSLEITVAAGIKNNLKPENIMIGYNEYIDENLEFNIKRTKILYS